VSAAVPLDGDQANGQSGRSRNPAVAAAIQRVDGVTISWDLVRLIRNSLTKQAQDELRRNGTVPGWLQDTLYELAEQLASIDSSCVRDEDAGSVVAYLRLGHDDSDGVVDVKTAAEFLGMNPDSVRKACREGRLPAVYMNGRWYPKTATLPEFLATRRVVENV
jgi:hypothetical protein